MVLRVTQGSLRRWVQVTLLRVTVLTQLLDRNAKTMRFAAEFSRSCSEMLAKVIPTMGLY